MGREIANRLSKDAAHDKVCWSWGNGQSHLQTTHHARPSSVELVRQSIGRGSQGLGGGGAREDEEEGLRREGNRDTKEDRMKRRKSRGLTGLCTGLKNKEDPKTVQLCRMRPFEKEASCETTLSSLC
jgi:hypothetical protein